MPIAKLKSYAVTGKNARTAFRGGGRARRRDRGPATRRRPGRRRCRRSRSFPRVSSACRTTPTNSGPTRPTRTRPTTPKPRSRSMAARSRSTRRGRCSSSAVGIYVAGPMQEPSTFARRQEPAGAAFLRLRRLAERHRLERQRRRRGGADVDAPQSRFRPRDHLDRARPHVHPADRTIAASSPGSSSSATTMTMLTSMRST